MNNTKKFAMAALALLLLLAPLRAPADGAEDGDGQVFTVFTDTGDQLFRHAGAMDAGDQYISADNQQYVIQSVDAAARTAVAVWQSEVKLPGVEWLETTAAVVVSAQEGGDKRLIAMYATHSDESYEPTDGTESASDGSGGIYDVCEALKTALEDKGVTVVLDETSHVPHDAGAYRRSRETAIELLKQAPDALIDVHRDGIPDPEEYEVKIDGEAASRVRLLVGRSNQNSEANKQFALELKAVADSTYPELIKDIFIGKGSYNQDLMSNAILLEMGTHTVDKERVIASAKLMSNVITDTLYGDVNGAAGSGQQKANQGAGSGIIWLIIAVVIAIAAFALLQTGRGREAWEKVKRGASEMTAGVIGKKKE
ncbi:MAG: stage II sporulation protein P [Oscillospiraceae bacterium]|jgi:stage II sporulation protein P|nr:stage II sporulation protein P [Oscillospiraceae bacterium]